MPGAINPASEPETSPLGTPASGGTQTLTSSATLVLPTAGFEVVVAPAGGISGIILPKGQFDGQMLAVINNSANPITAAASATSNVASGTSSVEAANTCALFVWFQAAGLWFRVN